MCVYDIYGICLSNIYIYIYDGIHVKEAGGSTN